MSNSPFSLAGKTALITGAYRGLGFAMARGLAQAGATVVLNGRKPEAIDAAIAKLSAEGFAASGAIFDVTDAAGSKDAV